jgi:hypothetical protein
MPKRKNPHAVALSKLGASKGGQARAAKLTPEQRREIAKKAAQTRWAKKKAVAAGAGAAAAATD